MTDLVLILGDQLTRTLAALRHTAKADGVILMAEVMDEATYVRHHKKKIALVFAAMRHFAADLQDAGWTVEYRQLGDSADSLAAEVAAAVEAHGATRVLVTEPGEYRLRAEMDGWEDALGVPVEIVPDDRFIASHARFRDWASGRKQLRMEYFYREMRRDTGLLMDGDDPEGGQWNYDHDNRKPASADLFMPTPPRVEPDEITAEVLDLVADRFADHPGDLTPFWFGVTREHAEAARDHFIEQALPRFGDYQDAMLAGQPFMYHSVLGLYLNLGLLDPLDTCRRAEAAYRDGHAPLNAVEGFIRQILGWREFIRGIYWREMPDYRDRNFFEATRDLPGFYWTGETGMACMKAAIGQTLEHAYAHHIQRLMVTGNFAMLAGIDPYQVHEWYLAVYADAYEWVELPNVLGMSQFADGGVLASKPYAAGGNYISKMSDYCGGCSYAVSKKSGPDSCPFNTLYWDFLVRNRETLDGNPRLGPVYRTWDRMKPETREAYRETARRNLARIEDL